MLRRPSVFAVICLFISTLLLPSLRRVSPLLACHRLAFGAGVISQPVPGVARESHAYPGAYVKRGHFLITLTDRFMVLCRCVVPQKLKLVGGVFFLLVVVSRLLSAFFLRFVRWVFACPLSCPAFHPSGAGTLKTLLAVVLQMFSIDLYRLLLLL